MKYLIKPTVRFFLWIGIIIYFFYKVFAFTLHFLFDAIWHLNIKQAFTDAHTEYFAAFYEQTDEYINWTTQNVREVRWYYRTVNDFFNNNRTYEK